MQTYVYQSRRTAGQRAKKQRRRRRVTTLCLLALIAYVSATTLIIPVQIVAAERLSPAMTTIRGENINLGWPTVGQAAIGASGSGVLASHNVEQAVPTASVIKTVMALAVLKKYPLQPGQSGPIITVTQADVDLYNKYISIHGSVMPVRVGQKLTERQALEAAMLRSANNVADMLATWAFGSMSAYRQYAQQYVASVGMSQTHIGSDASGFDPSTVSTASDLVRLGLVAVKNSALVEIAGSKSAVIPEVGTITNTNNLLGRDGIFGIKTGTDYQNKGSFLFASQYRPTHGKPVVIVGAVMGAPTSRDSRGEVLTLLASAKQGFASRTLYKRNTTVASYTPSWSNQTVQANISQDITISGWRGSDIKTSMDFKKIRTPAKAGTKVGIVSRSVSGKVVQIGTIVLAQDIKAPSLWWRLTHPFQVISV